MHVFFHPFFKVKDILGEYVLIKVSIFQMSIIYMSTNQEFAWFHFLRRTHYVLFSLSLVAPFHVRRSVESEGEVGLLTFITQTYADTHARTLHIILLLALSPPTSTSQTNQRITQMKNK